MGLGLGHAVLLGVCGCPGERVSWIGCDRPLARAARRHGWMSRAALVQPPPARVCAAAHAPSVRRAATLHVCVRGGPSRRWRCWWPRSPAGSWRSCSSGAASRHRAWRRPRPQPRRRRRCPLRSAPETSRRTSTPSPPRRARAGRARPARPATRRRARTSSTRSATPGWRVTVQPVRFPYFDERRAPRVTLAGGRRLGGGPRGADARLLGGRARHGDGPRRSPAARTPGCRGRRLRRPARRRGRPRAARHLPDERQGAQRARRPARRPCSSSTTAAPGTGARSPGRSGPRGSASPRCSSPPRPGVTSAPRDG